MSDEQTRHISVPSACQRIDKAVYRSTYYRGVEAGIYPTPFYVPPIIDTG
jgi:hypothetical protein